MILNIKTIIANTDGDGFYVSGQTWNDPVCALGHHKNSLLNCTKLELVGDWRFIGGPGWFGSEQNRRIYQEIAKQVSLDGWWPGEYQEVDLIIQG